MILLELMLPISFAQHFLNITTYAYTYFLYQLIHCTSSFFFSYFHILSEDLCTMYVSYCDNFDNMYFLFIYLHTMILKSTHTFLCNVDVPWVRVSLQNKKSSPARHPSFHILACQSSLYLERERCQIRNRFRTPFLSVNTEFKQWVCLERLTG